LALSEKVTNSSIAPHFLDNHSIELYGKKISSKKFIVCTDSHPFTPPINGLKDIPYLTNETVFGLEVFPDSMIVLGAGPIGIELSAALNRLGVKVTIVQRSADILKKDDKELVDRLVPTLCAEGVEILTETQTTEFARKGDKIVADIEDERGKRQIEAESVLVAVGRRPKLDDLALKKAGVEFDSKGIKVDSHLRTVARKWIAGKVAKNVKFAAIDEAVAQQGFKIVLLTRLSPVFPFNMLNYAFGLTKKSFWKYALASWIGMIPGTIVYVYFGAGLRSLADVAAG
jgi:pyruvate/2-oxoglutarate dehydrogenase complex dihydrolipoamide dehydrogenase (E3) component